MFRFHHVNAGWLLVGFIVLLSAAILALIGATRFLTELLRTTSLHQNQAKAVLLAQAGLMQAAFDLRFNDPGVSGADSGFRLGEYPVPADTGVPNDFSDDDVFILGGVPADFLLVAMMPATWRARRHCGGRGQRQILDDWVLRNVLLTASTTPTPPDGLPDGMPLVIDSLQVSWFPDNGERLLRADLLGNRQDFRSCAGVVSGDIANLSPNQIVPPQSVSNDNRLWFSATAGMETKTWIEIRFNMAGSPPSSRTARFVPASPTTSSAGFTVKSVGEVRKGAFPFPAVWRRLQAEYRLDDADTAIDLQEIGRFTTDTALRLSPPAPADQQRPGYKELTQRQP